ncbi:hypothetical protein ACIO6U_12640 [Streptomyces sp. NPDC087422]|uniref:hypothetical protein n=1 Tax=Streptomyces sp. NPDC087422 TaxID=3365786 RepID=UPI00380CC519
MPHAVAAGDAVLVDGLVDGNHVRPSNGCDVVGDPRVRGERLVEHGGLVGQIAVHAAPLVSAVAFAWRCEVTVRQM